MRTYRRTCSVCGDKINTVSREKPFVCEVCYRRQQEELKQKQKEEEKKRHEAFFKAAFEPWWID